MQFVLNSNLYFFAYSAFDYTVIYEHDIQYYDRYCIFMSDFLRYFSVEKFNVPYGYPLITKSFVSVKITSKIFIRKMMNICIIPSIK